MAFVITEIIYLVARTVRGVIAFPLNPYSWFIYTIVILYVGFFLIYKKSGGSSIDQFSDGKWKLPLILMALWILGYSLICDFLVMGNWWINSAPVFLVGFFIRMVHSSSLEGLLRDIQQIRKFKAQ